MLRRHLPGAWPGDPRLADSVSVCAPSPSAPPQADPTTDTAPLPELQAASSHPGPRYRAGSGPGTLPPPGSALHRRAPGIWLAAWSQRLAGGGARRGEVGRASSWHLQRALVKGHSFPGASCHQHPGMTRNEPKPTAGSRATGQGPLAQLCPAHRPLTRHRHLPATATSHAVPQSPGTKVLLKTRRAGWTQRKTQEGSGAGGPRPRPPRQSGCRHPLLRRGGSGRLGYGEAPTQRSSQIPGVCTDAWSAHACGTGHSWALQNRVCSRDFPLIWTRPRAGR